MLAIMKAIRLRIGSALFSGMAFTLLVATAQEWPPAAKPNAGRRTVERDMGREDQVAKLFEDIRAEAKVPPLQRIRHRADLEQHVCSSALTNNPPKFGVVSYITADPESITPELQKVASSNRVGSNKKPWYARYSVAVWRVQDSQAGKVAYRVGIGLYETAIGEFVDCHFTDDVHYCGNWKDSIARPCRGK